MLYEIYSRSIEESHDVDKSYGYYASLADLLADYILKDRGAIFAREIAGVDDIEKFNEGICQALSDFEVIF